MGNSSSIYKELPQQLQQEINDLYKSYRCRYLYLREINKTQRNPDPDNVKEYNNIQDAFVTEEYGKVHDRKRLKDIIPPDVKAQLDKECDDAMKESAITDETMQTLIQKRNGIATKIKEFNEAKKIKKFNKAKNGATSTLGEIGDDKLGGFKKHRSKKHRTKKHRSKKHMTKKHRSKKHRSKKHRSRR